MFFDNDDRAGAGWSDGWPSDDWPAHDWDADESVDDWPSDEGVDSIDEAVTGFRLVLSDEYADATDAELADALEQVMDSMSPAETLNFGNGLSQIARSAGSALTSPGVAAIARTAIPIAGGALGTVIGGPVGTALGGQLGAIAANALPASRPAVQSVSAGGSAPRTAVSRVAAAGRTLPVTAPSLPASGSALPAAAPGLPAAVPPSVSGGSASAAQSLVLTGHPLIQQALASAALGQHGQAQVGGIPVAQLLGLLSHLVSQAAAEADELLYHANGSGAGEAWDGDGDVWSDDDAQDLYTSIIDAENLELQESMDLAEYMP